MLTRRTHLQIIAFFVIAVVTVAYAAFRFTDFGKVLGRDGYTVRLQMADSGGIFTNAEVTYRGVQVGRVGEMRLTSEGMEVDLNIAPDAPDIPADLRAVVANRSAVGEQFVDLRPERDASPYLADNAVIPADRTAVPVSTDEVLRELDSLAASVPTDALRLVIDELNNSFSGTGDELQVLLDTTGSVTKAANEHLPQTIELLDDGGTVLDTQHAQSSAITSFSGDLRLLAGRLRESDGDIRRLIAATPRASEQLIGVLRDSGQDLGVLVANLLTTSNILATRRDGLRQVLVTYPLTVAGAHTVAPGDGTAHLGLVLNLFDPPPCVKGYEDTTRRAGNDTDQAELNDQAYCAEPEGSPISVRGAQNAPFGGTVADPSRADVRGNAGRPRQQMADVAGGQALLGPASLAQLLGLPG